MAQAISGDNIGHGSGDRDHNICTAPGKDTGIECPPFSVWIGTLSHLMGLMAAMMQVVTFTPLYVLAVQGCLGLELTFVVILPGQWWFLLTTGLSPSRVYNCNSGSASVSGRVAVDTCCGIGRGAPGSTFSGGLVPWMSGPFNSRADFMSRGGLNPGKFLCDLVLLRMAEVNWLCFQDNCVVCDVCSFSI